MKLGDIKVGQKFWLKDKIYLRIDMDLSTMFISGSKNSNVVCALDLSTYKVMCFSNLWEVEYESDNVPV